MISSVKEIRRVSREQLFHFPQNCLLSAGINSEGVKSSEKN